MSDILNHPRRLNFQGFRYFNELNNIKPSFAPLVLADERLRAAQLFSQIDLRQLGFMPCTNQGGAQLGVALAENGTGHAGTLNLLRDYPKIGYYETSQAHWPQ